MSLALGAGLEGRRVLIAGAAGGIGRAIAEIFAEAGAAVAAFDRDADAVQAVTDALPGEGHIAVADDLRVPAAAERVVAQADGLYALVNTAAILLRREDVASITEAEYDLQQEVNLRGAFFLARAAAEAMKPSGGGRIINFTSQAWWSGGYGGAVVYAATKGGIVSMSRGLARTYGPHGILVNCIAPGAVDTPMLTADLSEEAYNAFVGQIPLGRVGQPRELATAALFLASENASFISGATLNVSGGQLMY